MVDPDWAALGSRWWSHVQFLADDALEGRDTGSRGYARAADYMAEQFQAAGLKPAGSDGYRQPLHLSVARIDETRCSLELVRDGNVEPLKLGDDAAIFVSSQTAPTVEAAAVFVGYGLTVPEMDYDDLAGQDLRGKIGVFVSGGPPNMAGPTLAHHRSADESRRAFRKAGVAGAIFMQNPKNVEVPWSRMSTFRLQPVMNLRDPGHDAPLPLPLEVMFNSERADKLFAGSGHSAQEVLSGLDADGPLPHFPLAIQVRARAGVMLSEATCENVLGVLPGVDPELRHEYVVVSAHLDHVGIGEPIHGDRIYSGAIDNASGDASLIEVARSLKESGARPKRSIVFLSLTGEEKGLLGSRYFAAHPTVSGRIVANLNLDMFLPLFPLQYLQVYGLSESSLGDDIRAVAEPAGVAIQADKEPEHNHFIRSDQYSFIQKGVPALSFRFGYAPGAPEEAVFKKWYAERYHAPSDDPDQPVDLVAASQFNAILERLALRVANAEHRPEWKPDSFFRRFAR